MRQARMKTAFMAAALAGLAACAPQVGAPAPAATTTAATDPQDGCGPQVVVFVNAGDIFGEPPRRTGQPDAEALAAELARENAALERLQIAFDALMYCRWTEVRVIRADAAAGALPAAELPGRLAAAEGRMQRDLARGARFRDSIAARGARIDQAVEGASPGTRAALAAGRAGVGLPRALASAAVPIRARPEADAPVVGRLDAGTAVTLRQAPGSFVLADAGPGRRGYAPANAFTLQPTAAAAPVSSGQETLRRLAATNLARRESFVQALELASGSGAQRFEPAS